MKNLIEKQKLLMIKKDRPWWELLAALSVLLYLGAMILMYQSVTKTVFEPPLQLLIGNTIFVGLILMAVAIYYSSSLKLRASFLMNS